MHVRSLQHTGAAHCHEQPEGAKGCRTSKATVHGHDTLMGQQRCNARLSAHTEVRKQNKFQSHVRAGGDTVESQPQLDVLQRSSIHHCSFQTMFVVTCVPALSFVAISVAFDSATRPWFATDSYPADMMPLHLFQQLDSAQVPCASLLIRRVPLHRNKLTTGCSRGLNWISHVWINWDCVNNTICNFCFSKLLGPNDLKSCPAMYFCIPCASCAKLYTPVFIQRLIRGVLLSGD